MQSDRETNLDPAAKIKKRKREQGDAPNRDAGRSPGVEYAGQGGGEVSFHWRVDCMEAHHLSALPPDMLGPGNEEGDWDDDCAKAILDGSERACVGCFAGRAHVALTSAVARAGKFEDLLQTQAKDRDDNTLHQGPAAGAQTTMRSQEASLISKTAGRFASHSAGPELIVLVMVVTITELTLGADCPRRP
ncbi:hypothetical protein OPT61_g6746 [Boeremia exigua]|uniref:Uncharacterized protein n=1 Tax=Boeremia exigua TaxID=749465 RepID=A0ACC2I5G2_9PLEO|nr:hypothetical protein OPT61_g6746 [Boeremia exigua]